MAKYDVEVWSKADVSTWVTVDTSSEEEARDMARQETFQNGELHWKWEGLTEDLEITEIRPIES